MDLHDKYMALAVEQATRAFNKGEFPVGCVFVFNDEIISTGTRESSSREVNELDHGEIVALRKVVYQNPKVDLSKVVVYSTLEPCLMCYSTLILNGIRNIVFGYEDVMGGGTNLPLEQLSPLYKKMSIHITGDVQRDKCLKLFYDFFSNQKNTYWQDSLLSIYTLEQGKKLGFK